MPQPKKMTAIRNILALLLEKGNKGLTAQEAMGELGIKYNTAGVSLERLREQGWCRSEACKSGGRGRPAMRFFPVNESEKAVEADQ